MRLIRWMLLCGWLTLLGHAQTNVTPTLLLSVNSVRPGETFTAAIHLKIAPEWHTYWVNPGEAGQAAVINWELPEGFEAGAIQWPPPEKTEVSGLFNYTYHDEAMALVPIKVAPNVAPGPKTIRAKLEWQECKTLCVLGSGEVSATLSVAEQTTKSGADAQIEQWRAKLPKPGSSLNAVAAWAGAPQEAGREFLIEFSPPSSEGAWDFFPYANDSYEILPATASEAAANGKLRLRKTLNKFEGEWPTEIGGILVRLEGGKLAPVAAYEVKLLLGSTTLPAVGGTTESAQSTRATSAPKSLWLMLGMAFIGGLILNIMPCVLPVISLKILGFVQQSQHEPARVRWLGLLYAFGVLASFLALAAVVIGVKASGGDALWGMQFQNPVFVISLITLVVLVAMNLFGVFEVNLGGGAMNAAGALASKEGGVGAFFNGVLATVLATPCTAPFLGTALGFAFAQPAPIIIAIFTSIALGLAFPYVLLTSKPALLRFLPKPGPWMVRFKQLMGFPMLATGFWLLDTALALLGGEQIFMLGLFLVLVAVAAWVWGEFVQKGVRPALSRAVAIALLALGYFYVLEQRLHWRAPLTVKAAGVEQSSNEPDAIQWEPWSPEAVAKARSEGRLIFVDFTARWCPNCRTNKRFAIDVPSVRAKFKELNVLTMKADFTSRDPLIAAELKKFERAGIPMNLVYPAQPDGEPKVLPEFLTPSIVIKALEEAAGVRSS